MELSGAPFKPKIKKATLKKFITFSQKKLFLYLGNGAFLHFLKKAFLIFQEIKLNNKKFQELTFQDRKMKKITTLKKLLIFQKMELSSRKKLNKTFLYS